VRISHLKHDPKRRRILLQISRWWPEDFLAVPREVLRSRVGFYKVRVTKPLSHKRGKKLHNPHTAVQACGDERRHIVTDADSSPIKRSMVQTANRQAVRRNVRSTCLVPHDVRPIKAQIGVPELYAVAAKGACVSVGFKYLRTKAGMANAIRWQFHIQPHGIKDFTVDRCRKVRTKYFLGRFPHK
jgi:hypothetical protein